jgi:hypothetical protein
MSHFRGITIIALAAAARLTTGANNGSAVDLKPYAGKAKLVLNANATEAADNTLNVKVQDSANGTDDWQDVTGWAFAQVTNAAASLQVKEVDIDKCRRYIRVVRTVAGSTPQAACSVELVAKLHRT